MLSGLWHSQTKGGEGGEQKFWALAIALVLHSTRFLSCLLSDFAIDGGHHGDGQASESLPSLNNPHSFRCLNISLFTVLSMDMSREAKFS
jgi:H+/Cl- antiporter ClcA